MRAAEADEDANGDLPVKATIEESTARQGDPDIDRSRSRNGGRVRNDNDRNHSDV